MDTKLKNSPDFVERTVSLYEKMKNSRTFIITAVLVVIILAAWNMVSCYPDYAQLVDQAAMEEENLNELMETVVQNLADGNLFLYAQCRTPETEDAPSYTEIMEEYGSDDFFLLKKFLSYEIIDDAAADEGKHLL